VKRQPAARRRAGANVVVRVGVIGGAIGALIAGAGWAQDPATELATYIQGLRAAGKPLTGQELAPPWPAEGQNPAPLYLQAAQMLRPHDLAAGGYGKADWTKPEDLAVLAQLLEQDQQAFALIAQAASLPKCRFNTPYDNLVGGLYPHLPQMRTVARCEAAAAVVGCSQGRQAEALEHLGRCLVISRHLADEPTWLGLLVVESLDAICWNAAEYVVPRGALPEDAARRLAQELTAVDYRQLCAGVVRARRVEGLQLRELAKQGRPGVLNAEMAGPLAPPNADALLAAYAQPTLHPQLYQDVLMFLRIIDQAEAAIGGNGYQATLTALDQTRAATEQLPDAAVIARVMAQGVVLDRYWRRAAVAATQRQVIGVVLGLEIYRGQKGSYPEKLDDLQEANWPVPPDYFSDQPFTYRREGSSFLLYSVGPDLKDDGGQPIYYLHHSPEERKAPEGAAGAVEEGDLVWLPW